MRGLSVAFATVVGLVVNAAAGDVTPPPPFYVLRDFGVMPRPAFRQVLLQMPAVRDELKLTGAQWASSSSALLLQAAAVQTALKGAKGAKPSSAARTAAGPAEAALRAALTPRQYERLAQIRLQAQGPLAFDHGGSARMAADGPDLAGRLGLSDDQIKRAAAVAAAGLEQIERAAVVPITLDIKAGAPSPEAVRAWVEGQEFREARRKSIGAARDAWAAAVGRVEGVMTESQRAAYREMLGPPFDLSTLRPQGEGPADDADTVARALTPGGGGQRPDPNFDARVARPAYADTHPRVLFDEAHHNFHTTSGRYKPFAEVVRNDGYTVTPNDDPFTRERLAGGDVLIIANALGAGGMGQPGAADSAFTDAECDAVRDWVRGGGSLLLITDHAPFGSAAEPLAGRFGVAMSKGYTSDPANSQGDETSLVFTRTNKLLDDHAITAGRDGRERVNRVRTFTGQSLKGPAGSVAFLKLADTATDQGDDGTPVSAAGRAQGLAFAFGKGRVVVLGEAAELSAQLIGTERFGMNVPGLDNRQMALNIMHWLSGLLEPRGGPPK